MRYKKVKISGHFLLMMMETGRIYHFQCIKGLPDGTQFCYSIPDTLMGIWIVVSHPSFPIVADGEFIPEYEHPISFDKVYQAIER